jgi:hypothetical protein
MKTSSSTLLFLTGCHLLDSGVIEKSCEDIASGCEGASDDSGGVIDESDPDGDGFSGADDCNDTDGNIYPGAPELCDGVDSNCDGKDDEGMVTVGGENYFGIQEAIDAASAGATINICAGTWTDNLQISKDMILLGIYGAGDTVLTAAEEESVVLVSGGEVELRGLALTGGSGTEWAYGTETYRVGGGIQVQGGNLTLKNMILSGNSADLGGGLFVDAGVQEMQIQTSFIQGNSASQGGGIFTFSDVDLQTSSVSQNTSDVAGGIQTYGGQILLDESTVQDNTAEDHYGGVVLSAATLTCLSGGAIEGNQSQSLGGGVAILDGEVDGCLIEANTASSGAGIVILTGEATLRSLVMRGNTASEYGGGLFQSASTATLEDCIFDQNSAVLGAGIYLQDDESIQVLRGGTLVLNEAIEGGGGIYFASGFLNVDGVDFGQGDQVNRPDDLGLTSSLWGEDSYSGLGEDTSFVCQSQSEIAFCEID